MSDARASAIAMVTGFVIGEVLWHVNQALAVRVAVAIAVILVLIVAVFVALAWAEDGR